MRPLRRMKAAKQRDKTRVDYTWNTLPPTKNKMQIISESSSTCSQQMQIIYLHSSAQLLFFLITHLNQ